MTWVSSTALLRPKRKDYQRVGAHGPPGSRGPPGLPGYRRRRRYAECIGHASGSYLLSAVAAPHGMNIAAAIRSGSVAARSYVRMRGCADGTPRSSVSVTRRPSRVCRHGEASASAVSLPPDICEHVPDLPAFFGPWFTGDWPQPVGKNPSSLQDVRVAALRPPDVVHCARRKRADPGSRTGGPEPGDTASGCHTAYCPREGT